VRYRSYTYSIVRKYRLSTVRSHDLFQAPRLLPVVRLIPATRGLRGAATRRRATGVVRRVVPDEPLEAG
jgi:hypothetical protein